MNAFIALKGHSPYLHFIVTNIKMMFKMLPPCYNVTEVLVAP